MFDNVGAVPKLRNAQEGGQGQKIRYEMLRIFKGRGATWALRNSCHGLGRTM